MKTAARGRLFFAFTRAWQACCLTTGMNEHAYDISHLLDLEAVAPARPAPAPAAMRSMPAATPPVDTLEAALQRELQQAAAAHDALVAEYLRGGDVVSAATAWR